MTKVSVVKGLGKGTKVKNEWHAPNTQFGSGDYYGVGVKNKVGRTRDDLYPESTPQQLGTPPKSLA